MALSFIVVLTTNLNGQDEQVMPLYLPHLQPQLGEINPAGILLVDDMCIHINMTISDNFVIEGRVLRDNFHEFDNQYIKCRLDEIDRKLAIIINKL